MSTVLVSVLVSVRRGVGVNILKHEDFETPVRLKILTPDASVSMNE